MGVVDSAPVSPQMPATGASPIRNASPLDRLKAPATPGLSSSAPERSSLDEWYEVCVQSVNARGQCNQSVLSVHAISQSVQSSSAICQCNQSMQSANAISQCILSMLSRGAICQCAHSLRSVG